MKKLFGKILAVSLAVITAATVFAAPVSAGWIKTSSGNWRYTQDNGLYVRNRFEKIDGKWYMFNNVGNMITGWYNLPGTQNWYYLRDDGSAVISDWVEDNGQWYYIGSNGMMITRWREIDGKWYFFQDSGRMTRKWAKITDGGISNWYWFNGDGSMRSSDWLLDGGKWYWLDEKGRMVHDCTLTIDGINYTFNAKGALVEEETTGAPLVYDAMTEAVMKAHKGAESAVSNPYEMSVNELCDAYGVDISLINSFKGAQAMMMTNCDMLLVAEAKKGKVKELQAAFDQILENRIMQFEWYSVMGNAERCAAAKVVTKGNYVALVMVGVYDNDRYDCEGDVDIAVKAFRKNA